VKIGLTPPPRQFLEAGNWEEPRVILLGAALDRTESFRSGTGEGPDRIREVSDVLETYSPRLRRDLSAVRFADAGNVAVDGLSMEAALDAIASAMAEASKGALPILLGGEHTISAGAIRGVLRQYPDLMIVHADAHTDLRDTYEGQKLSHATVLRRVADDIGLARIAQLGIRSGTREEFELAEGCLQSGPQMVLTAETLRALEGRPIYLTIDIDVLDPSCAPGTGCPEAGGATFNELIELIYVLQSFNIVAVDIMEVLPAADVNDITSAAAAKLVRECALAYGAREFT
jgi:agmatinase